MLVDPGPVVMKKNIPTIESGQIITFHQPHDFTEIAGVPFPLLFTTIWGEVVWGFFGLNRRAAEVCELGHLESCKGWSVGWFQGSPRTPYGKRDPYHSHFRIPKDMGMVWVPLTMFGGFYVRLGVPENPIEMGTLQGIFGTPGISLSSYVISINHTSS